MIAPWVVDEMQTVDLNDERLNVRLQLVLDQLAGHPTASIPAACGGHKEVTGAYRLFDNEKATFANVLAPHIDATRRRIAGQPVVLLAQDTTEVDLTRPEQQVVGAGPLDGGARRGAFLHLLHAFTPDGTPLGTLYAQAWMRDDEPPSSAAAREALKKHAPIEEKESYRWVTTFEQVQAEARRNPQTRFVCLADSEADIYELLVAGTAEPRAADWIVRACQDRATGAADDEHADVVKHLRAQVLAAPVLYTSTIRVRGRKAKVECDQRGRRQPRTGRIAEVEVRATRVTLRPPWRANGKLPAVAVYTVVTMLPKAC